MCFAVRSACYYATPTELSANELYEVHVTVDDGGTADLSENEKEIKLSVVLGK